MKVKPGPINLHDIGRALSKSAAARTTVHYEIKCHLREHSQDYHCEIYCTKGYLLNL